MQFARVHSKSGLFLLLGLSGMLSVVGCDKKDPPDGNSSATVQKPVTIQQPDAESEPAPEPTAETAPLVDQPLESFQIELLELAFKTATAIPIEPHIKDRSRQQEAVIDVCLKLDQPQRVFQYIPKISNWRRSLCFANLAYYCAKHDMADQAIKNVALSKEIIAGKNFRQDWRKNMIMAKLAQTYVLLGMKAQVDELTREIHESEMAEKSEGRSEEGKVEQTRAMIADDDAFDNWVKALDEAIATQTFDATHHSLNTYAQLFDRFYEDPQRRELAEEKIKSSWDKIPYFIRLDLLMELARSALDHHDQQKSLDLVNDAQTLLESCQWDIDEYLPKLADLIMLRFRSGDAEKARTDADAAYTLYDARKDSVMQIRRAETLRPLAEAYYVMGDVKTALARYRRVIDEGHDNNNFRPKAEDFSGTCRSMALFAVEPDDELWERIKQVTKELGIQ